MTTPTPLRVRKAQLLGALYTIYANSGFGPQASSPTLSQLAPDALSQQLVAGMMKGTVYDMIAPSQVPDPSKANTPRPPTVPQSQPWPPLITVHFITATGIGFYESIDPSNPPNIFPA